MKKKIVINEKKQIDLVSDPIVISILNTMEKEAITVDWVAEELGEKVSIVADYMDKLHKEGLLELVEGGDGKHRYRKVAESIELDNILSGYDGEIHNHWIQGLVHHLESNLLERIELFQNLEDYRKDLKDMGFFEDGIISYNKVYLTREEAQELKELIFNFLEDHDSKEGSEQKKAYELALLFNPDVACLKKHIKENDK